MGANFLSAVSNAKSGADAGGEELMLRCAWRAVRALQAHPESVNMSQSPWGLVFVCGTHIFSYLCPVPVRFRLIPDLVAWSEGSKSPSNVTLPKRAWAQKDTQAIAHTVTSKGSVKSKWRRRERRSEIFTGSRLGHIDEGGARDNEACGQGQKSQC